MTREDLHGVRISTLLVLLHSIVMCSVLLRRAVWVRGEKEDRVEQGREGERRVGKCRYSLYLCFCI